MYLRSRETQQTKKHNRQKSLLCSELHSLTKSRPGGAHLHERQKHAVDLLKLSLEFFHIPSLFRV